MLPLSALLASLIALAAACSKSSCEQTCSRVAACKQRGRDGERIPGERGMPPDPACLERCQNKDAHFEACEEGTHDCATLLRCAQP